MHGTSDTKIARSGIELPDLMPQDVVPARKPCGAVTQLSISRKISDNAAILLFRRRSQVTLQQGVQGDAVPLPEREVSSLPSLFPHLPPQAAQERYLKSYNSYSYSHEFKREVKQFG